LVPPAKLVKFHREIWDNPSATTEVFVTTYVDRDKPLADVDIPSQCCVIKPPFVYSSDEMSGIFIRNEYVQAVKDIVALWKGGKFASDNGGSNDQTMHSGDVGPDGDTVMGTSGHVAEFSVASTPFPSTIDNPFLGTGFPLKRESSGVIITGSPGIGEYNRLGCIAYLTHSIQANLCYWMSSCICVLYIYDLSFTACDM
jgi:hypothetical protein